MTDLKNADEFIDEELLGIGVKYTDETKAAYAEDNSGFRYTNTSNTVKAVPKQKAPVPDAKYEPVHDNDRTFYDRLKGCVKWAVTFGALSCLIFYWHQAGLMASEVAVPSMCVCTLLVGWGVGKNAVK